MRTVRNAIADNWRLFVAVYAVTLLLELAFGWLGLGIAFGLAFVLGHCLNAHSRRNRAVLRRIEDWYFNDDVDAGDAGGAA